MPPLVWKLLSHDPLWLGAMFGIRELKSAFMHSGRAAPTGAYSLLFMIRRNRIRVISVRDMNRNETKVYERTEKKDS